jgi:ABC-2 type transport system permease protein
MIPHQLALVKREIWEHRSLFVTPGVVGLVLVLMALTALVFASSYQDIVDIFIVGAQNIAGEAERRAAMFGIMIGNTIPFLFAGAILTIFYTLDSLYAERKNKSILFWRSLPLTDAETVISKFLTAAIAIPLIAFPIIIVTHLLVLLIAGIFISIEGGSSMFLIWKSAPLFDFWAGLLVITILMPIWFSPFIGWFLFVSAWTKRSPLLMASLPKPARHPRCRQVPGESADVGRRCCVRPVHDGGDLRQALSGRELVAHWPAGDRVFF